MVPAGNALGVQGAVVFQGRGNTINKNLTMTTNTEEVKYFPGTYEKKRPDVDRVAEKYVSEWEKKRFGLKEESFPARMSATICFSRKIGVGALEVADILSDKIGYRVVDREVLEHIAGDTKLREKTIDIFDERYPGKLIELSSILFQKKTFVMDDYVRHLFNAVFSLAYLGPSIFVGRGVHLIMPRHWVLAVRFVSSKALRVKRLAGILKVKEEDAERIVDRHDKEQKEFFKKAFGKNTASPYEFDIVINCDYVKDPRWASEIVARACKEKFNVKIPPIPSPFT